MPVIKMKPTSPGTRFVVKLDKSHLCKGGPLEPLTVKQTRQSGRNNVGRITTRHQGSGSTTSTASSTSSATRTASREWSSASSTIRTAPAISR